VRAAVLALPRRDLARLARDLAAEGARRGLVHRDGSGAVRVVPLQLLPQLVSGPQRRRLHRVALLLNAGLHRLAGLRAEDARVRALLPLEAGELRWLDALNPGPAARRATVVARLDARVDLQDPDWEMGLRFYETNSVSVGGINDAVVIDELILRFVLPRLGGICASLPLAANDDVRAMVLDRLVSHGSAIGRPRPRVALVQEEREEDFETLADYFAARGVPAVIADPRELEVRGEEIRVRDFAVDIVYRDLELRDLVALEERGDDVRGMKHAFRRNRVVPSAAGDLDHKSALEVLTTPALVRHFPAREREVFARHVLWTRLVRETRTAGPDGSGEGADIDLVPFLRASRERLVLKPNRRWGGAGIVLGPLASESAWDTALGTALAEPGAWVAQVWAPPPVASFPVAPDDGGNGRGQVPVAPHHVVLGFVATPRALAIYGRTSTDPIVNVARRGSLVAVLRH